MLTADAPSFTASLTAVPKSRASGAGRFPVVASTSLLRFIGICTMSILQVGQPADAICTSSAVSTAYSSSTSASDGFGLSGALP